MIKHKLKQFNFTKKWEPAIPNNIVFRSPGINTIERDIDWVSPTNTTVFGSNNVITDFNNVHVFGSNIIADRNDTVFVENLSVGGEIYSHGMLRYTDRLEIYDGDKWVSLRKQKIKNTYEWFKNIFRQLIKSLFFS